MIIIEVDRQRAEVVFRRLIEAYRNQEYPYNLPKAHPPHIEENLPRNLEYGSTKHALFLFCLCYYMRGGIDSETAAKALAKMYEEFPKTFVPVLAINRLAEKEIARQLKTFGLGFNHQEIAKHWLKNSFTLQRDWKGNPLKIFEGVTTFEDACLRIMRKKVKSLETGFLGFQHKMVSMLIHFYVDSGLIERFPFPPPVDFHLLRIMFSNKVLSIKERNGGDVYGSATAVARPLLSEFCKKLQVDPIELGNTMWFLSRILCKYNPGNRSLVGERVGRKTSIEPGKKIEGLSQDKMYIRTCWSCPLRETCGYNMPSATYYIQGNIQLREKPERKQISFDF